MDTCFDTERFFLIMILFNINQITCMILISSLKDILSVFQ